MTVPSSESPTRDEGGAIDARRTRPRLALRFGLFTVLSCVLLFAGGFALFATHVSRMRAPVTPREADGIVVLTGGQSRIEAGVALLKDGKGRRLLISGVNPVTGAEDLRMATGGDVTLFKCCVDIDHEALDTIGNAEQSAAWTSSHAYGSLILVTNNYHMPRSLMEMRRMLRQTEIRPYPVVNTPLDHGEWLTKPDALRVMFTEYSKYVASLARGFLPDGPSAPDVHLARASAAE